jgi:DNA-binding LytR/AlgR family response regulator
VRALVVDDEPLARVRLARMLGGLGVQVVAEAGDVAEAEAAIATVAPDVVFLDVRLPGEDGIAFAARHGALPAVVFVTAFDEFAVRAFELDARDYLVKPVRAERLAQTVARLRERVPAALAEVARVAATAAGVTRLFDVASITRFWAADKYTLFRAEGEVQVIDESLVELAARFSRLGFVRVHRGELINGRRVRALLTEDGGAVVELDDGQRARVSRRSLAPLKHVLGLR